MLVDESVESPTYESIKNCSFYTYPLVANMHSFVRLYSLKMGKFHLLLEDKECDCLTYDSSFNIIRSNREVFERQHDGFADDLDKDRGEDEVKKAFEKKEYCNAVFIKSPSKSVAKIYPLMKDKDESSGHINAMKLIKHEDHVKVLDYAEWDDD